MLGLLLASYCALIPTASADEVDPMYVFDITYLHQLDIGSMEGQHELWDTVHLVAAVQGLANRDSARLYVRFILPHDDYWYWKLRAPGEWLADREVVRIESLDELLRTFESVYRGAVVYDPRVPATSNVASTIAGAESLLPVRHDESEGSIYTRLVASGRLPAKRTLMADDGSPMFTGTGALPGSETASSGTAKCDPYLWAREQYLDTGLCEPGTLAYYIDQYWLGPGGSHANHTLSNHDFFIARKAFFFDLHPWDDEPPNDDPDQPLGADYNTLCSILRSAYEQNSGEVIHVGGFVPWAWKYCNYNGIASVHEPVPSEWRYAEVLSCYNAYMDADALGNCAMANASFFQHFPLQDRYPQNPRPTEQSLKAQGHLTEDGLVAPGRYIMFYVGDYDAAAWMYAEFPRCWDDEGRGSVPLGWALNPNLAERMPVALHYARTTQTPADYFTAGDSGAGYLNPGGLEEPREHSGLPSGLDAWVRHCRPYFERWDLGIVGFVIDGFSPGLTERGLSAYAKIAPEGIVAQKIGELGVHDEMPYVRMRSDLVWSPQESADRVAESFGDLRPEFMVFRTILKTPSWHRDFRDALRAECPDENVQVVDPYTFMYLVKRYVQRRDEHPRPTWPGDTVSWSGPDEESGLRIRPVADGPYETTTHAGRDCVLSRGDGRTIYLYFAAHDGFYWDSGGELELTVEYFDGTGRWIPQVDTREGAYQGLPGVEMQGSGEWRTHTFRISNAVLTNRQNNRSDFRLVNLGADLHITRVDLRRLP